MKTVEIRVRPVVRYIVTRYTSEVRSDGGDFAGCETIGEFGNESQAEEVAKCLVEVHEAKRARDEAAEKDKERWVAHIQMERDAAAAKISRQTNESRDEQVDRRHSFRHG